MSSIAAILPAYNSERFIGEAIASVLSQTRPPDEVVVVDDASSDRTVEVARGFSDPRVRVLVNGRNSGPGASRNRGVEASSGEYLAFLDADDVWLPHHVATLAGALDGEPRADAVVSIKRHFGDVTGEWPLPSQLPGDPARALFSFMRYSLVTGSTIMARRSAFAAVGGFVDSVPGEDGRRVQIEDFVFALNLAVRGGVLGVAEATVLYRIHAGQASKWENRQALQMQEYRLQLLRQLENDVKWKSEREALCDRVARGQEDFMRRIWTRRQMSDLRAFVRLGFKYPFLRASSMHYLWRALVPASLARRMGSGNEADRPSLR